ncbi:hypothetical protein CONLIGDRAFT_647655 [Coniochaeta ligniaria NRRL 30616]|uniref:Uncharacterized protein n=1 Tax=Coniochaeta ligniaria NRRL 30616 TaxID=1408157 RepID=A0A1J7IEU4_9PEZI|nr:hypothetical protein CONLIGDRAFT_647655 [Coniochaeta ligniaria NRRL 30616]
MSDDPVPVAYVAVGFTIVTVFATAFLGSPRFRVLFGDMVMFFVRAVALAIGWAFVAVLYPPIQLFNFCSPFVPYDNSNEEQEKDKVNKVDLSIYKVSNLDFSQRFVPVFREEDE